MLHQSQADAFEGEDILEGKDVRSGGRSPDGVHVPGSHERASPVIKRWTTVAGYVDARGVVVGFLLEAGDGTRAPLDLVEPEGDVRVLTAAELKAAEAAGHVRAG